MLQLKGITKNYAVGGTEVRALRGVTLAFRRSEFVTVLGPSGCGKTTLLNIIGGLDGYTEGDLVINGRSTREYKDADWDTYRNHSVGFVFQSYNLIQHQSVLANVELALTLSGVSKAERRQRAKEALERVGLADQLHKKPNQMSGGQMQRVAIARALVNDPDILLADEPTGALDTETSVQIMEILKEIAQSRLVIMVTHNPDLADAYATRTVRLLDGAVIDDSMPYSEEEMRADAVREKPEQEKGKRSMGFGTALSLSFNNLMTKRARTLLTAFAGSIGIIGIALILALSTGVQSYIDTVQRDTLSAYPITIEAEESMLASMLATAAERPAMEPGGDAEGEDEHGDDAVYSNPQMYAMFNAVFAEETERNNLTALKEYLDREMNADTSTTALHTHASTIQYQYDVALNCYVKNLDGEFVPCDLSDGFASAAEGESEGGGMYNMLSQQMSMLNLWEEMLPGQDGALLSDVLYEQYDLVYGAWPAAANEIVLILDANNEISDLAFYALGRMTDEEVREMVSAALNGEELAIASRSVSYEEVCETPFKLVLNADYYSDKDGDGVWEYVGDDDALMELIVDSAYDLRITGVIRANEESAGGMLSATFGYTAALTEYVVNATHEREIVRLQTAPENENYDVFTGLPFLITEETDPSESYKAEEIKAYFASLTDAQKTALYTEILSVPPEEYVEERLSEMMAEYDTRAKMEELAAEAYGMELSAMQGYLAAYGDEELRDMLEREVVRLIEASYAAEAEAQVEAVMNTPSAEELAQLTARITAELTTRQAKVGYVMADWLTSTTMEEASLGMYLMNLSTGALDAAVNSVAEKQAAGIYASMGEADREARYAKAAALFDEAYTNETDAAVLAGYYDEYMPSTTASTTLADNLATLGVLDLAAPSAINIYAATFEDKDAIAGIITQYNDAAGEEDQINYTDYVALLMSGITDIINAISYGLIAFVAISLVVSSIMIGIITYISVLERTKEIGILRAIGASKRDVSLVFNAETLIVGLASGLIGIGLSLLLCIPISLIIHALSGITAINAFLEPAHCVTLVLISMALTLIAGVIPSRIAAKKDPVEALRTE